MATSYPQPGNNFPEAVDADTLYTCQINELFNQFVLSTMKFMAYNAQVWIEFPKDFLIRHTAAENCTLLTDDVRKAIVSMACVFRVEFITGAQSLFSALTNPRSFYGFLQTYSVQKDKSYFYNFITWIAFVLSLTMFMYQQGYEFSALSLQCLHEYPDILYFHNVGGWPAFHKYASLMSSQVYNRMAAILEKEVRDDILFARFLNSIKAAERHERYFRNGWLYSTPKIIRSDLIKKQISPKYSVALTLDSQRLVPGYIVKLSNVVQDWKQSPTKQTAKDVKETPFESMEHDREAVGEGMIMDLSAKIGKTSISDEVAGSKSLQFVGKSDSFSPTSAEGTMGGVTKAVMELEQRELQEMKSVFIISERFEAKRATSERERPELKRVIRVCSPKKRTERYSLNLTKLFNENLKNGNCTKLCDGVLEVCPQGCHIDDGFSSIVVLDTSSEEEDDAKAYAVTEMTAFIDTVSLMPTGSETSDEAQSGSQVQRQPITTTEKSEFGMSENSKDVVLPQSPLRESESDMSQPHSREREQSVGTTPEAQLLQRRQFVPTRSTGAIPKSSSQIWKILEENPVELEQELAGEIQSDE